MPLWFRLLLGLVQNGTYQWITQSFRLKKTSRSSSPIFDSSPLCQPDHVTKCHIHSFLEHFQVRYIHYCPGQSVPMFNNPFQEENLMSILNLPWCSLRLLSFCPIAGCMGEKGNPHLTTISFQEAEETDKVTPGPGGKEAAPSAAPHTTYKYISGTI